MTNKSKVKDYFRRYILSEKTWPNRWGVSVIFLIAALVVVDFLKDFEGARIYSLVLAASVLSAIHGGLLPAMCVSVFGALALDYFFVAPVNEVFDSISSFGRIFLYSASAALISFVVTLLKIGLLEAEHFKNVAQSANSAKDNLIAVIAHDLRNPLGVIVGFSDILKSKTSDNSLLNDINIIERNASVGLELINDLQELSSLESPDFGLNTSNFNLVDLIEDVNSSMLPMSSKKGIKLVFSDRDKEFFITADKHLIRRVFQNLIDNAIKYSQYGARVNIEIEEVDEKISVIVRDQGLGIPKEEQKKIFTPFYRSMVKPTAGESSTGLGLATVSAILKAHKATISVKSKPGQGSKFIITFRRTQAGDRIN